MTVNNNCEMTLRKLFCLAAIDFGIMWLMWVISSWYKTEKLFDLFGASISGLITLIAYEMYSKGHVRPKIQTFAILLWGIRLSGYLYSRILELGHDFRFGESPKYPLLYFLFWTAQGVWVLATVLPSVMMIMKQEQPPLNWKDWLGWTLFPIGFTVECIADYQKSHFRHSQPGNWDKFVTTGLWSVSRHPNYFGEILLWIGLYLSASSSLLGCEHLSVLSPMYVALVITTMTGIPPLELFGQQKWGHLPEYQDYLERTPLLIPYVKFW